MIELSHASLLSSLIRQTVQHLCNGFWEPIHSQFTCIQNSKLLLYYCCLVNYIFWKIIRIQEVKLIVSGFSVFVNLLRAKKNSWPAGYQKGHLIVQKILFIIIYFNSDLGVGVGKKIHSSKKS